MRWSEKEKLIIISNFDANKSYEFDLLLSEEIISEWELRDGNFNLKEQLYNDADFELKVKNERGVIKLKMEPLASLILKIEE